MSKKQDAAIAKIKATRGLSVKIAKALKIKKSAVYQWQRVPPTRVQIVSEIIDMPEEKIRPDVFARK